MSSNLATNNGKKPFELSNTRVAYLCIDQEGYIHNDEVYLPALNAFVSTDHDRVDLEYLTNSNGIQTGALISYVNGCGKSSPLKHSVKKDDTIVTYGFIFNMEEWQVETYIRKVSIIQPPEKDEEYIVPLTRQEAIYTFTFKY